PQLVPEDEDEGQHREGIKKDADREPALAVRRAPETTPPDPGKEKEVEGEGQHGHERGLRPGQEAQQEREGAHRDVDELALGFAARQAGHGRTRPSLSPDENPTNSPRRRYVMPRRSPEARPPSGATL